MKKLFLFTIFAALCVMTHAESNLTKGYHGSADIGYTFGIENYKVNNFEINTTHGYQFNPYFFMGGGVGFHFFSDYETPGMSVALNTRDSTCDIPIFADFRGNFTNTKVSPFLDLKLGYYLTKKAGFYSSLGAGVRVSTHKKQAIAFSVNYVYEKLEFEMFERFSNPLANLNYTRKPVDLWHHGLSLTLAYEF